MIDTDTLRKALEAAVVPLEWKGGEAFCDVLGAEYFAPKLDARKEIECRRAARIAMTIDLDALAKALGGGE